MIRILLLSVFLIPGIARAISVEACHELVSTYESVMKVRAAGVSERQMRRMMESSQSDLTPQAKIVISDVYSRPPYRLEGTARVELLAGVYERCLSN